MSHPDEGLIHAWLDGELDAEEAARVERLVAEDAAWAAAAAEARGLIAASARILSHLDSVPGDVLPKDSRSGGGVGGGVAGGATMPATRRANTGFTVQPWMRLAAGFVLVAGVGYAARSAFTGGEASPSVAAVESVVAMSASEAAGPSADRAVADVAPPAPVATGTVGAQVDVPTATPAAAPAATLATATDAAPAAGQAFAAKATTPSLAETAVASGNIAKTSDSITARARVLAEGKAAQTKAAQNAERLDLSNVVVTAAPAAPEARRAESDRASSLAPARDASRETARAVGGATTSGLSMRSSMAALADASTRLTGCWRTSGAAASDSILVNPLVLRSAGDTLAIAINAKPDSALVRVQSSTIYSGTVVDANGRRVTFSMTRVVRPARP